MLHGFCFGLKLKPTLALLAAMDHGTVLGIVKKLRLGAEMP